MQMADLVFEVFDELPLAVLALQIRRRETRKQQPRFAESLKDALPPILHPVDFLNIEEWDEFATGVAREVGLDALDELGDAALFVIAPRIADKNIVGHRDFSIHAEAGGMGLDEDVTP